MRWLTPAVMVAGSAALLATHTLGWAFGGPAAMAVSNLALGGALFLQAAWILLVDGKALGQLQATRRFSHNRALAVVAAVSAVICGALGAYVWLASAGYPPVFSNSAGRSPPSRLTLLMSRAAQDICAAKGQPVSARIFVTFLALGWAMFFAMLIDRRLRAAERTSGWTRRGEVANESAGGYGKSLRLEAGGSVLRRTPGRNPAFLAVFARAGTSTRRAH